MKGATAMAYNNSVVLIGNMGAKAKVIEKDEKIFAAFSMATTDSYKDGEGEWKNKDTIWHDVLAFHPKLVEQLKTLDTKDRIKVTGSLSYRFFEVSGDGDKPIRKREATVIARKVEAAPLVKSEP